MTINTLGGRKFLLSATIIFLTFLLILINKLGSEDYLKVIFTVIGLYAGLNVYQKSNTAKKSGQ